MWIPTSFERKPTVLSPEDGVSTGGTELWADDVQISAAVEQVFWDQDSIHLAACTDCLKGDGSDGAWLSVRRAGSHVLFLPSFWSWLEYGGYEQGYDDPPAFLQKGAMLLDRSLYLDLRSLIPGLPALADLQPLAGWEAIRLLRFEAPVEVLGKESEPVQLRRALVLRTDWWGTDDTAVQNLEHLLESWVNSYDPVAIKHISWHQVPVPFYLSDGPRTVEWQPLSAGYRNLLLLAPGYVVDTMPDLPEGHHTNTLTVTTHPREGLSLQTEIRVDDHLLYDFARYWLGVDLCELARSRRGDGEYYIITCANDRSGAR